MKFKQKKERGTGRRWKGVDPIYVRVAFVLIIGAAAGGAVLALDMENSRLWQEYFLERPGLGEGEAKTTLQVQTPYGEKDIMVSVAEQRLEKEEIQKKLEEISGELGSMILGENPSLDEVRSPLNLMQELEDLPVYLEWSVEDESPVRADGSLDQEKIEAGGTLAKLQARLQWEEEVFIIELYVRVYPEQLTEEELFLEELQAAILQKGEESRYADLQELPKETAGAGLSWRRPLDKRGFFIMLLAAAGAVLLVVSQRRSEQEKEQKRRMQMEMDYPEIVSKLKLYMEAGLTCRSAWMKISDDYQKKRQTAGTKARFAYEEIVKTGFEMQSGVSEQRAYERLGERCRVPCYKKLMGLLIQNVRKGNRGLGELLEAEMWQAFEGRKDLAKKQGEEAGTKLLLPMMGMLAVVMVIVIAPALMSMQM